MDGAGRVGQKVDDAVELVMVDQLQGVFQIVRDRGGIGIEQVAFRRADGPLGMAGEGGRQLGRKLFPQLVLKVGEAGEPELLHGADDGRRGDVGGAGELGYALQPGDRIVAQKRVRDLLFRTRQLVEREPDELGDSACI